MVNFEIFEWTLASSLLEKSAELRGVLASKVNIPRGMLARRQAERSK